VEGITRILTSAPLSSFDNEGKMDKSHQPKAQSTKPGTPYSIHNIGNGSPVKLMDFIRTIENAVGEKAIKEMYPMQPGDVYKTFADVKSLKDQYNYSPSTTLEKGIGEFINWYKSYYQ
jgi:UDP-glucuronate 4-epimerase